MTLYLELDSNPTGTAQQTGQMVRGGKIHHFVKKNVRNQKAIYQQKIREALADQDREAPHYTGPVAVKIHFFYAIKQKKLWGQWKDSRPDVDNSVKGLLDVMTQMGFWDDDSLVCRLDISKTYSEHPGVLIDIWRLIQP